MLAGIGAGVLAAVAAWRLLLSGPAWRRDVMARARRHVADRTPYEWGGGHHGESWGLDCSGLVLDCFRRGAGIDPGPWDSRSMASGLPVVDVPEPGDVAVYAPRHVVLVERWDPSRGVAVIIGANGGGPTTTTIETARRQGAFTKRESTHLYRQGFLGFRSTEPWARKAGRT